MAIQADGSSNKPVKTTATGNAADTGTPVTPAPTRRAAPDEVTSVRSPSRAGYGMNNYPGASSLAPGQMTRSPLGDNLADSMNDPTLDAIVKLGTARNNTTGETMAPQTRTLLPGNVPDAYGQQSNRARQPSSAKFSAIPASLDKSQGDPVRKPD
jgi:hypothetical protein